MQLNIRETALNLGYIDAKPITGHPFDVWLNRIKGTHLEGLSVMHDPAKVTGWPINEITLWAAITPSPPIEGWPDGCCEIGAHYMALTASRTRRAAWQDAVTAMGYEIKKDAFLPDRAAAIRAGLGVHGLNGLMIAPNHGSFVDITVLAVRSTPPKEARGPEHDLSPGCSKCGACIAACPNGAISENGVDTQRCLRHYMSKPDQLPEEDYHKMGRRFLGCDTCQLACPSNAGLKQEQPSKEIIESMMLEKLLTNPSMDSVSKGFPHSKEWMQAQGALAAANMGRKDLLPLVEALVGSEDEQLCKRAQWAVNRLRQI